MADGLRVALLRWYDASRRELPWRGSVDPYRVWVSEAMLQQTTVAAVVPYFERWMARFPTVESLAAASDEDVLALWQGLGYYRRARNLLAGARIVARDGWPQDIEGWMRLPGVGRYTAGAVCSICLSHSVPAVDGNVERVFARLSADDSQSRKSAAYAWASRLADCDRPGDVNQALMDLGATVCRPKSPVCSACPMRRFCKARKLGVQDDLPTPVTKRSAIAVVHEYVVPVHRGQIGVRQFGQGEWWAGMYGFPQRSGHSGATDLGEFRHTVTRHRVEVRASLLQSRSKGADLLWKTPQQLATLPMPTPHRKILDRALQAIGSKATGIAKDPSSAKK